MLYVSCSCVLHLVPHGIPWCCAASVVGWYVATVLILRRLPAVGSKLFGHVHNSNPARSSRKITREIAAVAI